MNRLIVICNLDAFQPPLSLYCIDKKRNEGVTADVEHHLTDPRAQFSLLFQ